MVFCYDTTGLVRFCGMVGVRLGGIVRIKKASVQEARSYSPLICVWSFKSAFRSSGAPVLCIG